MSRFSRFELVDRSPFPYLFSTEASFFYPKTPLALNPCLPSFSFEDDDIDFTLDLFKPAPTALPALLDCPSLSDDLDAVTDLIQIEKTPFYTSTHRVQRRVDRPVGLATEMYLKRLSDRVSALELSFDRLEKEKKKKNKSKIGERKYTWTAEIKTPEENGFDRKYKWVAEVKNGKKKGTLDKSYKYTAEIKGKGEDSPLTKTYTFKSSNDDASESSGSDQEIKGKVKKDKKKKCDKSSRLIEIQDFPDHGAIVLRQAFARRTEKRNGKRKELSRDEAAIKIQVTFRAYLIKRSQALRALRELAIAKTKLKEIRALFNNFSYRRRLTRDAEERQRFSEKIIVLLLTVDAIEGADMMVRAAKKSMVDELEAMLEVVDPQPGGKSLSMKRRQFDMPDAAIQKELAAGVAQVVKLLDEDLFVDDSATFEATKL